MGFLQILKPLRKLVLAILSNFESRKQPPELVHSCFLGMLLLLDCVFKGLYLFVAVLLLFCEFGDLLAELNVLLVLVFQLRLLLALISFQNQQHLF